MYMPLHAYTESFVFICAFEIFRSNMRAQRRHLSQIMQEEGICNGDTIVDAAPSSSPYPAAMVIDGYRMHFHRDAMLCKLRRLSILF